MCPWFTACLWCLQPGNDHFRSDDCNTLTASTSSAINKPRQTSVNCRVPLLRTLADAIEKGICNLWKFPACDHSSRRSIFAHSSLQIHMEPKRGGSPKGVRGFSLGSFLYLAVCNHRAHQLPNCRIQWRALESNSMCRPNAYSFQNNAYICTCILYTNMSIYIYIYQFIYCRYCLASLHRLATNPNNQFERSGFKGLPGSDHSLTLMPSGIGFPGVPVLQEVDEMAGFPLPQKPPLKEYFASKDTGLGFPLNPQEVKHILRLDVTFSGVFLFEKRLEGQVQRAPSSSSTWARPVPPAASGSKPCGSSIRWRPAPRSVRRARCGPSP